MSYTFSLKAEIITEVSDEKYLKQREPCYCISRRGANWTSRETDSDLEK